MRPVAVLGLDIATRTGWAVWAADGLHGSGWWDLKPERGESTGMRYLNLRRRLERTLEMLDNPVLVVYEQSVVHAGQQAAEIALGSIAVVQEVCAVRSVEHATVFPSTLKKWVTGNGRADKKAMVAAAKALVPLGYGLDDHNQADAIHIARWGWSKYGNA